MLGALLGITIWLLGILVVGFGGGAAFDPGFRDALALILTWSQPPVVALALATLSREGIPSGAAELRAAIGWLRDAEPPFDFENPPVNPVLVALELAAVTIVSVGLVLCFLFSSLIVVATVGTAGESGVDPTGFRLVGIQASDAFAMFIAGCMLWQVAWILESLEGT